MKIYFECCEQIDYVGGYQGFQLRPTPSPRDLVFTTDRIQKARQSHSECQRSTFHNGASIR